MTRVHFAAALSFLSLILVADSEEKHVFWPQWGRNSQHTGTVDISAQPLDQKLTDIVYDDFVEQEKAENAPLYGVPTLTIHYQTTLIEGDSFFMVKKDGVSYPSCSPAANWVFGDRCGPNAWNKLQWNVIRYDWKDDQSISVWKFHTDWKPEPNGTNVLLGFGGLYGWEPVFHPAIANGYLYVPGAAGTVWKVRKSDGKAVSQVRPEFGETANSTNTFVSGPLTVDRYGTIYYNVLQLNLVHGNPWNENDVANSWLVKVTPDDRTQMTTYSKLLPGTSHGDTGYCPGTFFNLGDGGTSLPWPPTGRAIPPSQICGSQRPAVNIAPAVAPDGTIYTVSVAHFDNMVSYLVAVNPDLSPKWASTLQNRLKDGCGRLLTIAQFGVVDEPNSCRYGTTPGVDPTTNSYGSGTVSDDSTSSPTILPDGSVLFGASDNYNYGRGHLFHFDARGGYLNAYTFGWDSTAAVYVHDGSFSIVIKDNHYPTSAYCSFPSPICAPLTHGRYLISQLDPNLKPEWSFQNTRIDAVHPDGYEWCINAPAIDSRGLVYATSEDGHLYSLPQGHRGIFKIPHQTIFLKEALGAAYTPLSISGDGKVYSQNDGHLFVVGGELTTF